MSDASVFLLGAGTAVVIEYIAAIALLLLGLFLYFYLRTSKRAPFQTHDFRIALRTFSAHVWLATAVGAFVFGVSLLLWLVVNVYGQQTDNREHFSATGVVFAVFTGVCTLLGLYISLHIAHMFRHTLSSWGGLLNCLWRDLHRVAHYTDPIDGVPPMKPDTVSIKLVSV